MITQSKIAKLAHVSVSTVSKAFDMSQEISEETRERIFQIAKELGCFKKYYNKPYSRWMIAILCPELNSQFYTRLLSILEGLLAERNCEICVVPTNFSDEKEQELLQYYDTYSTVDGILRISSADVTLATETPIVQLLTENRQGIEDAITYFAAHGVKRIAFLGEPLTRKRLEIYCDAMKKNGLPIDDRLIVVSDDRFEKAGYLGMKKLLSQATPRAVFCAYDYIAIGAMRAIREAGLSIPRDVAVVGVDNLSCDEYLSPALASVDVNTEASCREAVEALLDRLRDRPHRSEPTPLSRFCLRESAILNEAVQSCKLV